MIQHFFDRPKYGNKKLINADGSWDSQGEYKRWLQLRLLEKAGKISDLRRRERVELAPSCVLFGRKRPPIRLFVDFAYSENGVTIYEDFKGILTPVYKLKRHLAKVMKGIEIRETHA